MAQTAWKLNVILRKAVAHSAFFSDYVGSCQCGSLCALEAPGCLERAYAIITDLSASDSLTWEVWAQDAQAADVALVGILRLTQIRSGDDANAHFYFFDAKGMKHKMPILRAWREWVFADSAGWRGLHRVTIEVPAYAKALGKIAVRLGAGGPHKHPNGLRCEGWRRDAIMWKGSRYDRLIMGVLKTEVV